MAHRHTRSKPVPTIPAEQLAWSIDAMKFLKKQFEGKPTRKREATLVEMLREKLGEAAVEVLRYRLLALCRWLNDHPEASEKKITPTLRAAVLAASSFPIFQDDEKFEEPRFTEQVAAVRSALTADQN
jgi:hypothetical protein